MPKGASYLTRVAAIGSLASMAACGSDEGGGEVDSDLAGAGGDVDSGPAVNWDYFGNLDMIAGTIDGELGSVTVAGQATVLDGYGDSYWIDLTSIVELADGSAGMTMLSVAGGFNSPAMEPGTRTSVGIYPSTQEEVASWSDEHVSVIGCSGRRSGEWEWDVVADRVDMSVEQDDGDSSVVRITYDSTFVEFGETRTARSTVAVRRPSGDEPATR